MIIINNDVNFLLVYVVDIDGDGDMDVFLSLNYNSEIVWYENNGDGVFGVL